MSTSAPRSGRRVHGPSDRRPFAVPRRRRVPAALALAFAASFASACGAPEMQPETDLFREASLALEDEAYSTAIENYKKLLEEYPFSEKAEIASLNIAYAYYLKKEYGQAIAAFNDFERLYPVSPLLPFVSYTSAMCWLEQAKAADRDPTASDQALLQFKKVASEFPNTLYADMATFRQQQARENLAAHEIAIGDYYRDRKRMDAAAGRYRYAMEKYPTTESASRAAERLKKIEVAATEQAAEHAAEISAERAKEIQAEAQSQDDRAREEQAAVERAKQLEAEAGRVAESGNVP